MKTRKIDLEQLLPMQPQKSTQLTASSWTSRLQNRETINVCLSLSSRLHRDEIFNTKARLHTDASLWLCPFGMPKQKQHSGLKQQNFLPPHCRGCSLKPRHQQTQESGAAFQLNSVISLNSHMPEEVRGSWDFFFFQIYVCKHSGCIYVFIPCVYSDYRGQKAAYILWNWSYRWV